jgi:hypothetical protein
VRHNTLGSESKNSPSAWEHNWVCSSHEGPTDNLISDNQAATNFQID